MAASSALTALHELNSRLCQNLERVHIAETAIEIVESRMGYELLAVLLYDESNRSLQPLALSRQGQSDEFLRQDFMYIGEKCSVQQGITHWVAESGTTARIDNVLDNPRYLGIRDDIRSELCVPIHIGGKTLGVINTETSHLRAYDIDDEVFLETVAGELAMAIELSRLYTAHDINDYLTVCSWCHDVSRQDSWMTPLNYLYKEKKSHMESVPPVPKR